VESSSTIREELFKEREESARLKEGRGPFLRKRIILRIYSRYYRIGDRQRESRVKELREREGGWRAEERAVRQANES